MMASRQSQVHPIPGFSYSGSPRRTIPAARVVMTLLAMATGWTQDGYPPSDAPYTLATCISIPEGMPLAGAGYPIDQGLWLDAPQPGGLGDRMGVRKDDVLVEVNGEPITTIAGYRSAIGDVQAGDQLDLLVIRNGQLTALSGVVPERRELPAWQAIPFPDPNPIDESAERRRSAGVYQFHRAIIANTERTVALDMMRNARQVLDDLPHWYQVPPGSVTVAWNFEWRTSTTTDAP